MTVCLAACGAPAASVAPPTATATPIASQRVPCRSPTPLEAAHRAWLDTCEGLLRAAGDNIPSYGPAIVWRERAAGSADSYEAFIHAAAREPALIRRSRPRPDDGSIIFAMGPSLQYRAVIVSLDCDSSGADRATPWAPRDKYWDRDEVFRRGNDVSVAVHFKGGDPASTTRLFVDTLRPAVDACIAERPALRPAQRCDQPRVLPAVPLDPQPPVCD